MGDTEDLTLSLTESKIVITSDHDTRRSDKKKDHKKKKKKRKHHKHQKKQSEVNFEVEGVVHIVLGEMAQKMLHCVVGDHVTAETPWTRIQKDLILEQVEMDEIIPEFMPFARFKQEIVDYPDDEMVMGYIPNEQRDYDEFYFCLTIESRKNVQQLISAIEAAQQARLDNTINKVVHEWTSLGSEREINENKSTNTRGFYKVELETIYPIMKSEVTFKFRLAEQARDGYVELKIPSRYAVPNIYKKRISTAAQVAPSVTSTEAQTNCPYPKNAWTQYEYLCKFQSVTKEFIETFKNYIKDTMEPISDALYVNFNINFYTNDYKDLYTKYFEPHKDPGNIEYMSFKDIQRCKDKMISGVAWHPMWSGVVAVAYTDISPLWYQSTKVRYDSIVEAIHGQNPVLIWSFNDGLTPKLLLETNAEVHCLAFCPHNENLLIGGCNNGQILLWDITNKINKVEEEEILTTAQQHYRQLMFSMLKWMKNTRDLSIVPTTATANLVHAHQRNVTSINWIDPSYEVTKTGYYIQIGDNSEETSLQFVTSSADGTLKFWDLKQKPILMAGDYKPQRKSRRLKKRPSALTTDVSPFRILNRKMSPLFQASVYLPREEVRLPLSIAVLQQKFLEYVESNPEPNRIFNITERIKYKPVIENPQENPPIKTFAAGTFCGDIVFCSWEGFEYGSGDLINNEQVKIFNTAKYHDGPVVCVSKHPKISDLYLTVGGKVFALWKESLLSKPVVWRRSKHRYLYGNWSAYSGSGIRLNRSDGNRETWSFTYRWDTFYYDLAYSGKPIFEGKTHPMNLKQNVFAIADTHGSLRLIYVSEANKNVDRSKFEVFQDIIDATARRKDDFLDWQQRWIEKNASWIIEQREKAKADEQHRKEEEENEKQLQEELKAQEAIEEAKRAAAKLRPPPGQYTEWAHEQWILKEQERMGNVLLTKKRVNRETLINQQIPLKKLEAEMEKKRLKQRDRLQKADEIFNDTIAMLFPDLVEDKQQNIETPIYTEEEISTIKQHYFDVYPEIKEETDGFVEDNPFVYSFDWKDTVEASKTKKKLSDFRGYESHKTRQAMDKEEFDIRGSNSQGFIHTRDEELMGEEEEAIPFTDLSGSEFENN